MNVINRISRWMRGVGHAKGFGVQSPAAYRFIRAVVGASDRPDDDASLRLAWPCLNRRMRRRGELYFRIARSVQPGLTVDFCPPSDAYAAYMKAGCPETVVQRVPAGRSFADYRGLAEQMGTIHIARISMVEGCDGFVEVAMNHVDERSVFIIEDIWRDDLSHAWWDELRQDPRVSVTYDLYTCGLLTFDRKLFKRDYLVNL